MQRQIFLSSVKSKNTNESITKGQQSEKYFQKHEQSELKWINHVVTLPQPRFNIFDTEIFKIRRGFKFKQGIKRLSPTRTSQIPLKTPSEITKKYSSSLKRA